MNRRNAKAGSPPQLHKTRNANRVICDRMHMLERINTVKLCATGVDSPPTGVDRGALLGSIMRSCRTPADASNSKKNVREADTTRKKSTKKDEISTLHGDPRNCAF